MTQNVETTQKLAKKSTWATGFLTFFFPLFGYIYTGRYKALFKTAGILFGMMVLCIAADPSLEDDDDFMTGVMFLYGAGTALENTRAVGQAKKRLQEQTLPKSNSNPVKIQLLKLAKAQTEVTLADCVIETDCSPQEVRQLLEELEGEDLIRSQNRDRDGAVVYRIL